MGLIHYMSRNPVGLAIPPSAYDEEFVVASINSFVNNFEMIENIIQNNLAHQNRSPYRLIKKRAENKRTLTSTSKNSNIRTFRKRSFSNTQMKSILLKTNSNPINKISKSKFSKLCQLNTKKLRENESSKRP